MAGDFDGSDWDESKSEQNFALRSYDFKFASGVFDGPYTEREDLRQDFGERRYIVVGEVDGLTIRVVWTPRGSLRRIISSRRANSKEAAKYRGYCKTTKQRSAE